jgi:hypothetical protein
MHGEEAFLRIFSTHQICFGCRKSRVETIVPKKVMFCLALQWEKKKFKCFWVLIGPFFKTKKNLKKINIL